MSKSQYVLLTGAKNNAGDFYIGDQARSILSHWRPDRQFIEYDAWRPLTDEQLQEANQSCAILLTGGPAVKKKMWPTIYTLVNDLQKIQVPIIMFGLGWKSLLGNWENTWNYPLDKESLQLLEKIEASQYLSSVRDYHTLNALHAHGKQNVIMTGCPGLYNPNYLEQYPKSGQPLEKITFSLGVSFKDSPSMEQLMKDLILNLNRYFKGKQFQVAFHHSLNPSVYDLSQAALANFVKQHQAFAQWLEQQNIPFVDLSGSVDAMKVHYQQCDLHIGFRVHAHIMMTSLSKRSILIAEDGRGKALRDVLGGLIFDGYSKVNPAKTVQKKWFRTHITYNDPMSANLKLANDVLEHLDYDIRHGETRLLHIPRNNINTHALQMKAFLQQLP